MMRLGILGSTRGTMMMYLQSAIQRGELDADIAVVLSNKSDALILENANKLGLKSLFVDTKHSDDNLTAVLRESSVDLVVLVGYMRILSNKFVETWKDKIINVHPSLLPAFSGKMDRQVHQAVLDAHMKETGCSVHFVTEIVDAGPVIVQKKCDVLATDTVDSLRTRVQSLEGMALVEAIHLIMKKVNHEPGHF